MYRGCERISAGFGVEFPNEIFSTFNDATKVERSTDRRPFSTQMTRIVCVKELANGPRNTGSMTFADEGFRIRGPKDDRVIRI